MYILNNHAVNIKLQTKAFWKKCHKLNQASLIILHVKAIIVDKSGFQDL